MNILVVGGTGFLGRRIVEKLLDKECQIIVMARKSGNFPDYIKEKIKMAIGDIRILSDVIKIIKEYKVDRIIHSAYTLTAEGENNPYLAVQVNILGTCNIFEAARLFGIKRVVFASSIAAYADAKHYGDNYVNEDELLLRPPSIYGASKVFNELMASKYENKYGMEIISVRISAVYGLDREDRGVTAWFSQMLNGVVNNKEVELNIRPDQLSSFICVNDVAEQLVRLVFKEKLSHRLYNSGGATLTPSEFYEILKKYYPNAQVKFNENAPRWPYPPKVDGSRLEQEIDYKIKDPEDGVLEELNRLRRMLNMPALKK